MIDMHYKHILLLLYSASARLTYCRTLLLNPNVAA